MWVSVFQDFRVKDFIAAQYMECMTLDTLWQWAMLVLKWLRTLQMRLSACRLVLGLMAITPWGEVPSHLGQFAPSKGIAHKSIASTRKSILI